MPGDHIHLERKQVFLNGKPLNEPYKFHKTEYFDSFRDTFPSEPNTPLPYVAEGNNQPGQDMLSKNVVDGDVVVPPGHYFAMGDNRDHSLDSRYWGFVPRENIIGKPLIIYWSYDAPTDRLASGDIGLDHIMDIAFNFFSKTRWNRTFMLIRGFDHPAGLGQAEKLEK